MLLRGIVHVLVPHAIGGGGGGGARHTFHFASLNEKGKLKLFIQNFMHVEQNGVFGISIYRAHKSVLTIRATIIFGLSESEIVLSSKHALKCFLY